MVTIQALVEEEDVKMVNTASEVGEEI